jgi:hypothetical protein
MGVYKLSSAGGLATPRTNYSSFLAGNEAFSIANYESIATANITSAQATVEFTSIPTNFKHLQVRIFSANTSAAYYMQMQFNSSTADYNWHGLWGGGDGNGTLTSIYNTSPSACLVGVNSATSVNSSVRCAAIVDILDYRDTNKFKTTRSFYGYNSNTTDSGQQHIGIFSATWRNTSAITSIKFLSADGNFPANSHYALYGIKG